MQLAQITQICFTLLIYADASKYFYSISLELPNVCVWLDDRVLSMAVERIEIVVKMVPYMSPQRICLL